MCNTLSDRCPHTNVHLQVSSYCGALMKTKKEGHCLRRPAHKMSLQLRQLRPYHKCLHAFLVLHYMNDFAMMAKVHLAS